ncbi:MAG: hypothetical protein M3680_00940 [Myxococcota bacterium]|nr:hypothetical protein [Myxococcota bacterium]
MRTHPLTTLVSLLFLLVCSIGSAAARSRLRPRAPYTIDVAIRAGHLDLTFTNTTDEPITIPMRVVADRIDHDDLRVTLTGHRRSFELVFTGPREGSALEIVSLAPRARHVETVDLDLARRGIEGHYEVTARWDAGITELVATTVLDIPYSCGLAQLAEHEPTIPPSRAAGPVAPRSRTGAAASVLLLALALLVGRRRTRAGAVETAVPCSAP